MVNQTEFCPPGGTHFTWTMRPKTVHTGGKTAKSGNSVVNCSCLPRPLLPLRTCMWTLPGPTSAGRGPEGGVHRRGSGNTPPVFTLGSSRSLSSRTSSSSSSSSLRFSFSFLESGPTIQWGRAPCWEDDGSGAAEIRHNVPGRGGHVARTALRQRAAFGTAARAGSGAHHQEEQVQAGEERRADPLPDKYGFSFITS